MTEAFVVSAVRTPVGKAPNGALRHTRPDEMAAVVIKDALARVPALDPDEICPLQDMWKFYGLLAEPKELVVIDMADHLFDGHTSEVGEALEDLLKDLP